MSRSFTTFIKSGFVAASLLLSSSATLAHDIYIWPSFFSISSEKATSVPVFVTASHTTFRPDFPMSNDGLEIYGVDGKKIRKRGSYYQGARTAMFDLEVENEGTYLLKHVSGPSYFTSYMIGRSDKPKFMRASKAEAKERLPKKAKDVKTKRYNSVAMSFLTNNAPSDAVLKASGKGFELTPITHPADYVTGEEIELALSYDGKAVVDMEVVIEQEGPQYREEPIVMNLKSDEAGKLCFTATEGGRYMMKALHEMALDSDQADIAVTRVYYAFEVIYE